MSTFDKEIDRTNTNSLKYDFKKERNKPDDVFPMWVADMDFKTAPEVSKAIEDAAKFGVYGYTKADKNYFLPIHNWWKKFFDVELKEEWLITTPGVVFALSTAVKTLTEEGDCVLICNPVYYPFTEVVEDNKRKVVSSDLILKNGRYEIDFKGFEKKIVENKVKVFLFCSPHNPVGRVWTKEETEKIVSVCKKYGVFIVSDEIHCDFVWQNKHICMLAYKDYQDKIILCTSPSKTFNLAGLQTSNIFIPNEKVRKAFQTELWKTGYSLVNTIGLVSCKAAYSSGEKWLEKLKEYLKENICFVEKYLEANLPKVKLVKPEGTYLLWLDFRALKLDDEKLERLMIENAKLWLDSGKMFGQSGRGFQRINIALPKRKLEQALEKIKKVFCEY